MTDYSPRFNGIESRLFQIETQIKGIHALIERLVAQDNVVTRPDTPDAFDPFNTGYGPLDYVPPGANFFPRAVLHFDSAPMPRPAAPVPNTHTQTLVPPTPERGAVVGQHRKVEPKQTTGIETPKKPAQMPYAVAAARNSLSTTNTAALGSPFRPRAIWPWKEVSKAEKAPRPSCAMSLARAVIVHDSAEASIALQLELKSTNPAVQKSALASVSQNIVPLSLHRYGNFVVQRALHMDTGLVAALSGAAITLALSQFGTYVLQSAIECCPSSAKDIAEQLLSSRLYYSLTSRNSMHVWRKLMDVGLPAETLGAISVAVHRVLLGRMHDMITQEAGSVVCQALLEGGVVAWDSSLIDEVFSRFRENACNQWGAWVVQYLVGSGDEQAQLRGRTLVLRHAEHLSVSQYGAKTVQAALRLGDESFQREYASTLCSARRDPLRARPLLIDMGTTSHGLHIVTSLLTSCPSDVRSSIVHLVRNNAAYLKSNKTGVRLFQLCERARAFTGY